MSEAGATSLGWYNQERLCKKLAFELDFESVSELPVSNSFFVPATDG